MQSMVYILDALLYAWVERVWLCVTGVGGGEAAVHELCVWCSFVILARV